MKYIIPLFASLMCLVMVGCSSDDIVVEAQNESIGFTSVGDPVQVSLNILPGDFLSNISTTRAIGDEDPITYTPDEYDKALMEKEAQINNFWVFEYNEEGNLIYDPQYVSVTGTTSEPLTVELSDNAGYPVTIYVVANANGSLSAENWITEDAGGGYNGFETISDLLKQNIPFSKDGGTILIGLNAAGDAYDVTNFALPMAGSVGATLISGTTITVPLNFMVAKVMFGATYDFEDEDPYDNIEPPTDFDTFTADLYYVNAPSNVCTVGALGDKDTSDAIDYSALDATWIAGNMQIDLNKTIDDSSTPATYQYVLYTTENFQGFSADGGATGDSNKYLNAPQTSYTTGMKTWNSSADGSSWDDNLGIKSFMSKTDAFCSQAQFTVEESGNKYNKLKGTVESPIVFSGGNSVDNFNVRRNCVYHVMYTLYYDSGLFELTVRLYYIEPEEWFENGETFTTNTK